LLRQKVDSISVNIVPDVLQLDDCTKLRKLLDIHLIITIILLIYFCTNNSNEINYNRLFINQSIIK